jgi:hypothetical protein
MSSMPLSVEVIWACSASGQLVVLLLVLSKGNFRRIPFFTIYTILNLCQAAFVLALSFIPGIASGTFTTLAWISECVTLLAQALAATEILRLTLRPYAGIWGLAWRALAATSTLVVMLVVLTSQSHGVLQAWFEINRGYHLTFATALMACLLLVRYYSIPVPSAYKLILGGFCINSCAEVLINTLIQILFHKGFAVHQAVWQFLTTLSFVVAVAIWAVALRRAFPAEVCKTANLSDSEYQRISPEINEQLRLLNERLQQLWKMEASSH